MEETHKASQVRKEFLRHLYGVTFQVSPTLSGPRVGETDLRFVGSVTNEKYEYSQPFLNELRQEKRFSTHLQQLGNEHHGHFGFLDSKQLKLFWI